jgi:hypothetical protein
MFPENQLEKRFVNVDDCQNTTFVSNDQNTLDVGRKVNQLQLLPYW